MANTLNFTVCVICYPFIFRILDHDFSAQGIDKSWSFCYNSLLQNKMKNNKNKNQMENGLDRIKEIKRKIENCSPVKKLCKVEVYETWQNIFDPNDENC